MEFPKKIDLTGTKINENIVRAWSLAKDYRIKNGIKNTEKIFINPYPDKILELWNIFEGKEKGISCENNKKALDDTKKMIKKLENDIQIYKLRLNPTLKSKNPTLYQKFEKEYEELILKLKSFSN